MAQFDGQSRFMVSFLGHTGSVRQKVYIPGFCRIGWWEVGGGGGANGGNGGGGGGGLLGGDAHTVGDVPGAALHPLGHPEPGLTVNT